LDLDLPVIEISGLVLDLDLAVAGLDTNSSATVRALGLGVICLQGYLYRRRAYGVTVNNEREWYVLTPTRLCVYSGRDVKDKKTELVISKACQVVVGQTCYLLFFRLADKCSRHMSPTEKKHVVAFVADSKKTSATFVGDI